jgi:hypothetical protein
VETIALADGDLAWVFPHMEDPHRVVAALSGADADIRKLADHLGVRPGWTGSGLEFHRAARIADLCGFAETDDVSFLTELGSQTLDGEQYSRGGPPWEVTAEIAVRCDADNDCGMHTIEAWPASRHDSPLEAATTLARAARWLLDRGTAEPVTYWREHDPSSGHR